MKSNFRKLLRISQTFAMIMSADKNMDVLQLKRRMFHSFQTAKQIDNNEQGR